MIFYVSPKVTTHKKLTYRVIQKRKRKESKHINILKINKPKKGKETTR